MEFSTWTPEKNHFGSTKDLSVKQFNFLEHLNNLKNIPPTIKNLLCSGKVLWMLKFLHETTCANKGPLFLRTFNIHGIFPLNKMFLIVKKKSSLDDLNAPRTKKKKGLHCLI